MKKEAKWLLLGILILSVLLFINHEIYQHRVYMAKAKEAIKEYKYDHATAYLQKANSFPFHKKVESYLLLVEKKKQQSIMAYMRDTNEKQQQLEDYKNWMEHEILLPISSAFEQNSGKEGVNAKPMKNLFYQLNFKVEEKRIELDKDHEIIHEYLREYIQKNQIAYSYWEQKQPVEAEKMRQEAIIAHTNLLIAWNDYVNQHCEGVMTLSPHYY